MPRPLSNPEWAAFMQSPNPNTLAFPPWGGIVNWGGTGQYVLCFQMPSGEWALSDITDGVPYGNAVVAVQDYLQTVGNAKYTPAGDVFWSTLPANFMASALQFAADAGALAKQTISGVGDIAKVTSQEIADVTKNLLGGITPTVQGLLWPVAIVAAVVLFVMYGKKG